MRYLQRHDFPFFISALPEDYILDENVSLYKVFCAVCMVVQSFSMDNASDTNPEDLLREIAENGISQSVCINDLGMCPLLPLWGFHRL